MGCVKVRDKSTFDEFKETGKGKGKDKRKGKGKGKGKGGVEGSCKQLAKVNGKVKFGPYCCPNLFGGVCEKIVN